MSDGGAMSWLETESAFVDYCRVIALDARGHGASANASRPFRHADDVAALLRELNLGPAVLVGLSMGGGIAVDTALEYPSWFGGWWSAGLGPVSRGSPIRGRWTC